MPMPLLSKTNTAGRSQPLTTTNDSIRQITRRARQSGMPVFLRPPGRRVRTKQGVILARRPGVIHRVLRLVVRMAHCGAVLDHLVGFVAVNVESREGSRAVARRDEVEGCGLDGAATSGSVWQARGCRIGRVSAGCAIRSQICQLRRPSSVNKVAERLLLVLVSTAVFVTWANGRACSGS